MSVLAIHLGGDRVFLGIHVCLGQVKLAHVLSRILLFVPPIASKNTGL